jgi:hypothetical protein
LLPPPVIEQATHGIGHHQMGSVPGVQAANAAEIGDTADTPPGQYIPEAKLTQALAYCRGDVAVAQCNVGKVVGAQLLLSQWIGVYPPL